MRRAAFFLLIVGSVAPVFGADESLVYRGQTAAEWLQQLTHPSASARAAAAQAFVKIGKGHEDTVEPLIGLLSDRDAQVRFYAAYAIGKLEVRHEPCIAALIKALPDKDEHVRYTAQWSLAQIAKQIADSTDGTVTADEPLANLLAKAETEMLVTGGLPGHLHQIRSAIARFEAPAPQPGNVKPPTIASSDEVDEIDHCIQSLASDDAITQAKAIEQLRKLGPKGVERLLASSESVVNLGRVRWHLPKAIASLGPTIVPVLADALRNSNDEISDLAANALMELGPVASVAMPDLIKLIENEETTEDVQQRAIRIMIEIGPAAASAMDLLVRALKDAGADESTQASAAGALGAIGADAKITIPALIDQLANINVSPYVRSEIASALVRIDPKSERVTRALITAFENSASIFDAIAIAERLCECGPGASEIVPRLIAAIDETSFDERAAALRILGKLGSSRADEVGRLLFERLMDPTEALMVRVAAARALGELGPAGVRLLVDELQSGDEANQIIAARALVEIGPAARPAKDTLVELLSEHRADVELRSLAAVAIGQLGAEASDAIPVLTKVLRDRESDGYLRSMCAVAIGQADSGAKSTLEPTLDDSEPEVQIASAYALCKTVPGHARGLATLVQWLTSDEYRGSAINAIIDIGEVSLSRVVERMNDTSQSRDTRLSCIEVLSAFDDRAITPLLRALNDELLAQEAGWALRDRGNELIPKLVAGMEDEASFNPQARAIMSDVIEDMLSGLGGGDGDVTWEGGHPLVRRPSPYSMEMNATAAPMREPASRESTGGEPFEELAMEPQPAENLGTVPDAEIAATETGAAETLPIPEGYKTVDVFYGTNRKPLDDTATATASRKWLFWSIAVGILSAIVVALIVLYRRGARRQATAGLAGTTLVLLLGLSLFVSNESRRPIDKPGPRYGVDYTDRVEMGLCKVTIPDIHQEGELEAPTLLRLQVAEDLQKHIVLRSIQRMESHEFFAGVRREMQSKGNHILVFIHGYNVSFEDAARRTAQMSSDLKFAGAAVFYSWPSQADWWKYRVDEKNVALSVDQLKSFLLAIAQRSEANTINLVAHSMGNRALTDALKEIDVAATEREQLFNQVILAAPDIDADIFKQRIAPAIVTKAKHITLYASSKDLALVASKTFNSGDPRAGDAGESLVVVPGIETIDVSSGDSSLLGHSYYGDSVSVLRDIEQVLRDEPASSRRFLEPVSDRDDLTYWIFQPRRIARGIP